MYVHVWQVGRSGLGGVLVVHQGAGPRPQRRRDSRRSQARRAHRRRRSHVGGFRPRSGRSAAEVNAPVWGLQPARE